MVSSCLFSSLQRERERESGRMLSLPKFGRRGQGRVEKASQPHSGSLSKEPIFFKLLDGDPNIQGTN